MTDSRRCFPLIPLLGMSVVVGATAAEESGGHADLAKKLSNPVAALISVPFQLNYDTHFGPAEDGYRYTLNVQPVVPVSLNAEWNLISRTILPLVHQDDIFPGAGHQTGIGDILQSVFLSPVKPTAGGWIWGAGPVLLLPTASDDLLGGGQFGVGPTVVALRQSGHWTYGVLANHIWSMAGDDDRADVDATYAQPFISFTTPSAWTFSANAEMTHDWEAEDTNLPITATVAKVAKVGDQLMQFQAGPRYYLASTENGPDDWGFRLAVVLLFPR